MRVQKKQILVLTMISVFMTTALFFPELASAGDKMKRPKPYKEIWTMLDEIYDIVLDTNSKVTPAECKGAPVAKTGQTQSYAPGDDGDLQIGVPWPDPRFTDNGDGAVTDNLTGLIWLKDANCISFFSGDSTEQNSRNWAHAVTAANSLATGYCGLTDGSSAGDWRLSNIRELHSLIDFGVYPAQPAGHPFTGVQPSYYWSSTTPEGGIGYAWGVGMDSGFVLGYDKGDPHYVWPVRGGN